MSTQHTATVTAVPTIARQIADLIPGAQVALKGHAIEVHTDHAVLWHPRRTETSDGISHATLAAAVEHVVGGRVVEFFVRKS